MNLHVLAVGSNTADLRRVGRELESLDAEIEDEFLPQEEHHFPYAPYGPGDGRRQEPLADYISLTGGAEIADLTVPENAPIAGLTLEQAAEVEVLGDRTLVVGIERDDTVVTRKGRTEIRPHDIVTVFSPDGNDESALKGFRAPDDRTSSVQPD